MLAAGSETVVRLAKPETDKLKVFISYSRKDSEAFADELVSGLEFHGGFNVSIDRHSIVEGEEWKSRLGALIADADTVVFIISPGSCSSPICQWEVDEAARLSKRILPVLLIEPAAGTRVPELLASLNYTRFDEGRSFMAGLKALVTALNTDPGWLREHTRLLARALEWDRANRAENRMLSGPDIADAKSWAARRPRGAPEPTALHLDFIRASEEADAARTNLLLQQNIERAELLQKAEAATEERAAALAKAEEALKATARLQKRQALGAAIAVVTIAGSGWWAYGVVSERQAVAAEAGREDIRGQILSYATARGETAADTAQGYKTSPYTTAVSQSLMQSNKSIVDALVDAHDEVARLSSLRKTKSPPQRPFLSTSLNGQIYLSKRPKSRIVRSILVAVDDPNLQGKNILKAPKHDLEAMEKTMLVMGFAPNEITKLYNADRTTIEAEIEKKKAELAGAKTPVAGQPPPNTFLMFYFSGHGVEMNGAEYIIPSLAGGKFAAPEDIDRDAVVVQGLTKNIDSIAAASIVILDSNFAKVFDKTPR